MFDVSKSRELRALLASRANGQMREAIDGIRVVREYPPDTHFAEEYQHTILLGGMSGSKARSFLRIMHQYFRYGLPLWAFSSEYAFTTVLDWAASHYLPQSKFHSPHRGYSELHYDPLQSTYSRELVENAVHNAFEHADVLEFMYRSIRKHPEHGEQEELHVRRVNVSSIDALGFNGRHSRGTRRFTFDNVIWAITPTPSSDLVTTEPMMRFTFQKKAGVNSLVSEFGRLGDKGQMLFGVDTDYERYIKEEFVAGESHDFFSGYSPL